MSLVTKIKLYSDEARTCLESLVDNFAETVQPIYAMLNWTWGGIIINEYIPNVKDIKEACMELINTILDEEIQKKYYYHRACASGGIEVSIDLTTPNVWSYVIKMIIDE